MWNSLLMSTLIYCTIQNGLSRISYWSHDGTANQAFERELPLENKRSQITAKSSKITEQSTKNIDAQSLDNVSNFPTLQKQSMAGEDDDDVDVNHHFHQPIKVTEPAPVKLVKKVYGVPDDPSNRNMSEFRFKYVLNPVNACSYDRFEELAIVTVIHTSPRNFKRRMEIRHTWGNQRLYKFTRNTVLFAMGSVEDAKLMTAVSLEADHFHDIIQGDFHDSYKNLTYKGIMWLHWMKTYCRNAEFVLKVDDDIIVNIFNVAKHLKQLKRYGTLKPRSFACMVYEWNMPVLRDPGNKWFVDPKEWVGDFYPTYCSGMAFVISNDLVPDLHDNAKTKRFFWVDDFFISGYAAMGLPNVSYHDMGSLYILSPDQLETRIGDSYSLFGHAPGMTSITRKIWKKLLQRHRLTPDGIETASAGSQRLEVASSY